VVITLVPDENTFRALTVGGIEVDLAYPTAVGLLGTGFLPVNDPTDPATRVALLSFTPPGINLYDGLQTFFDADTTLPHTLRTLLSFNQTANLIFSQPVLFERVLFDCTAGTPVSLASFTCTIPSEVDALARPIPPAQRPACSMVLTGP